MVILVDGGSCLEREDRFVKAVDIVRSVSCCTWDWVFVGLWWVNGLVPLYMGRGCDNEWDALGVIGGRGCWDLAIQDVVKLMPSKARLILIGCCRGPCLRRFKLPDVFERSVFVCLAGYSEKLEATLRDIGFDVVTTGDRFRIEVLA